MLALSSWRGRCTLEIAALLVILPAAAQDLVDPNRDTALAEAAEPTDPTDLESDLEESKSEKPDSEKSESDLEEARRIDGLQQASNIEKILVTGEKQNTLQGTPTSSTSFSAGDLQALRIENISDLADYTPNLGTYSAITTSRPRTQPCIACVSGTT